MSTFVDTNVLLDVATNDPKWADWSLAQLDAAAVRGPLVINDIVYTEFSARYARIEDVDGFIGIAGLAHEPTPRSALFLAAKAFQAYRRRRGARSGVLPEFFIGAHAAIAELPLLTRDVEHYRTYFPKLQLIAP